MWVSLIVAIPVKHAVLIRWVTRLLSWRTGRCPDAQSFCRYEINFAEPLPYSYFQYNLLIIFLIIN